MVIEDNRLGHQYVFEVLIHRKFSDAIQVYRIHTFNISKVVNNAIIKLVEGQSDPCNIYTEPKIQVFTKYKVFTV